MYVRTLVKQFGFFFLLFFSHKVRSILFFSWQYHSFSIGSIFINTSLAFLFSHCLSVRAKSGLPNPSLTMDFFFRHERKRRKKMIFQLKHSISRQPQVDFADFSDNHYVFSKAWEIYKVDLKILKLFIMKKK